MISRIKIELILAGSIVMLLMIIAFSHLSAVPIPGLYIGEILNGTLEKSLILPRAERFYIRCKSHNLSMPLSGEVRISDADRNKLFEFHFLVNLENNSSSNRSFYLTPILGSNTAFTRTQINNEHVILSIKLDEPNREPIQVRLEWPKKELVCN